MTEQVSFAEYNEKKEDFSPEILTNTGLQAGEKNAR